MRLFLALKPDRSAEGRLARRVLQLQDHLGASAAWLRWTPPSNIHATLHFLGEVEPVRVRGLCDALRSSIVQAPFEIELGDAGAFPESGAPRVIWLEVVKGGADVVAVHAELGRRLVDAGFVIESRPLSPHLTVARVPDRERARVKTLRERLQSLGVTPVAWNVDRVTLFRSDLSGAVPKYAALHEIELTAPGSV